MIKSAIKRERELREKIYYKLSKNWKIFFRLAWNKVWITYRRKFVVVKEIDRQKACCIFRHDFRYPIKVLKQILTGTCNVLKMRGQARGSSSDF